MSIRNPYELQLPAVVSFSGGRTSGYMLHHILEAHGGQPEELRVCFNNTGLEHHETYEFVHRVETEWGVRVDWLETYWHRGGLKEADYDVKVVNYETASRDGEPFRQLLRAVNYLPNPRLRSCTDYLKIQAKKKFLMALPAFADGWDNAIGLRHDEPRRVAKIQGVIKRETPVTPLNDAKATLPMILDWWKAHPFDLDLPHHDNSFGNCVGCFLKQTEKTVRLMREVPEHFDFWLEAEANPPPVATGLGRRFRRDRPTYADLMRFSKNQMQMDFGPEDSSLPCHCTD